MDFSKSFHGALLQQLFLSNTREPINQILNLYGLRLALSRQWGRDVFTPVNMSNVTRVITYHIPFIQNAFIALGNGHYKEGGNAAHTWIVTLELTKTNATFVTWNPQWACGMPFNWAVLGV